LEAIITCAHLVAEQLKASGSGYARCELGGLAERAHIPPGDRRARRNTGHIVSIGMLSWWQALEIGHARGQPWGELRLIDRLLLNEREIPTESNVERTRLLAHAA
jgi:hypothetical protein